jgi:uncharacterized protein (TIGR00251 family)
VGQATGVRENHGDKSPVKTVPGGVVISCKAAPSASKTAIAEIGAEEVRVRIAAPPVDGKANKELIRFFAKLLGVSKSSVEILKGESGKNKRLLVAGVTAEDVQKKLTKGAQ